MNQPSIKEIFLQAIAIVDRDQRRAFVDQACGGDPHRRALVERLLEAESRSSDHLDQLADRAPFQNAELQPGADSLPTQPTQLLDDPLALARRHERLGPYKLLELLGEGGMGLVFMAQQMEPVRRLVAIKIIKPGMDSQQIMARFEAERQALSMMNHPNIASALDAGATPDGRPYFVMELVKGRPITTHCDACQLSMRQRLELFIDVCQAVQHAHQRGIIHRDIKPSNVLVAHYDDLHIPKVIDFGVAKAVSQSLTDRTMFTGFGQIVGTLEYMSPEQARFNQLDIDTRSDIYSLGVLLYELLTGSTPLDKRQLHKSGWDEALRMIREEQPLTPSQRLSSSEQLADIAAARSAEPIQLNKQMRGELDWIVMKAIEKDRGRRYDSAKELAADIQRYLTGHEVLACPPTLRYRASKFIQRHATALATSAFVAAALLLGMIGTAWQAYRATVAESELRVQLNEANTARSEAQRSQELANQQTVLAQEEKVRADQEAERAKQHERQALREAASARSIAQFLERDLLELIDPENQLQANLFPDKDLTVRALLDRASGRLDDNAEIDPANRASLHFAIGGAYMSLGYYAKSQTHFQKAVSLATAELGADDPATLRATRAFGQSLSRLGRFEEAEPLLVAVLSQTKQAVGDEHEDVLNCLTALVYCYFAQNKYALAKPHAENLVELSAHQFGPNSPEHLSARHELAAQLNGLNRRDEANAIYRDIYARSLEQDGSDATRTMSALQSLGPVYFGEGKYREALDAYQRSYAHFAKLYDGDHPELLDNLANQARILMMLDQPQQAKTIAKSTLDKLMKKVGFENSVTRFAMTTLAEIHNDLREYEAATNLLDDMERRLDADATIHEDRARVSAIRFETLKGLGDFKAAEQVGRQTLQQFEQSRGPQHPDTQAIASNLGVFYFSNQRYTQARNIFEPLWERKQIQYGPDHYQTLSTAFNIACTRYALKQQAEAIQLLEETLNRCIDHLGIDHPQSLATYSRLVEWYQAQTTDASRYARSETLHQRFADGLTKALGSDHLKTIQARVGLAVALIQQKKDTGREQLKALAQQVEHSALAGEDRISVYKLLAQAETAQKEFEQAAALYRLAFALAEQIFGSFDERTCELASSLCTAYRLDKKPDQELVFMRSRFEIVREEQGSDIRVPSLTRLVVISRTGMELADILARNAGTGSGRSDEERMDLARQADQLLSDTITEPDNLDASLKRRLRLTYGSLITLHRSLGNLNVAEKYCRAQSALTRQMPDNRDIFLSLETQQLIALLTDQGKFDQVDDTIEEWLAQYDETNPPQSTYLRTVLNSARRAKLAEGNYTEALKLADEIDQRMPTTVGVEHSMQAVRKAETLFLAGRVDEAEAIFVQYLPEFDQLLPAQRGQAYISRLRTLLLGNRFEEAEQIADREGQFDAKDSAILQQLHNELTLIRAQCLIELGKSEQATTLIKPLIERGSTTLEQRWIAAAAESLLGENQLKSASPTAETEPLLVRGYEGLLKYRPLSQCSLTTRRYDLAQAARRLRDFYRQKENATEAEKWQTTYEQWR